MRWMDASGDGIAVTHCCSSVLRRQETVLRLYSALAVCSVAALCCRSGGTLVLRRFFSSAAAAAVALSGCGLIKFCPSFARG